MLFRKDLEVPEAFYRENVSNRYRVCQGLSGSFSRRFNVFQCDDEMFQRHFRNILKMFQIISGRFRKFQRRFRSLRGVLLHFRKFKKRFKVHQEVSEAFQGISGCSKATQEDSGHVFRGFGAVQRRLKALPGVLGSLWSAEVSEVSQGISENLREF